MTCLKNIDCRIFASESRALVVPPTVQTLAECMELIIQPPNGAPLTIPPASVLPPTANQQRAAHRKPAARRVKAKTPGERTHPANPSQSLSPYRDACHFSKPPSVRESNRLRLMTRSL